MRQLLAEARLVTLTGAGGSGKTRLALRTAAEMADSFRDGACFIELASLADAALVVQLVAQALNLREVPNEPLVETLEQYLENKHLLLVLDNCEHLRVACGQIAQKLLFISPSLRILATSREPLAIPEETISFVPPLSIPEDAGQSSTLDLMQYDAPSLFVERARSVLPTFAVTPANAAAILQVCRRLEGIPLAIELAAARVNLLTVQQIAARLDNVFALLTAGNRTALIPRHQTLRAAIDWSYALLSEQERALFRRLGVFAGEFSVEAVEVICAGSGLDPAEILDSLSHLIDKSLVIAETQRRSEARYHLLETIRQYALERLRGAGEEARVRREHFRWFLTLAEKADSKLRGSEQRQWLDRLEAEHDNLREALAWLHTDSTSEIGLHLRFVGALFWFWNMRGYWGEGRRELQEALARSGESPPLAARARALFGAAELARLQGDHAVEQQCLEQSAFAWRAWQAQIEMQGRTSAPEQASLLREAQRGLALTQSHRAAFALFQADHVAADLLIRESLALSRSTEDDWGLGFGLVIRGRLAFAEGDHGKAFALLDESVRTLRETGDSWQLAHALHWRSAAALGAGDSVGAGAGLAEALVIYRELGDRWNIARALTGLAEIARSQGDDARALPLYEESLAIQRQLGSKWGLGVSLHNLGHLAQHRKDYGQAAALFNEALALNLKRGDGYGISSCLAGLAGVAAAIGDAGQAARLFGKSQALFDEMGTVLSPSDLLEFERNVASARSQMQGASFDQAWQAGCALDLQQAVSETSSLQYRVQRLERRTLIEPLNARERQILHLIAAGRSNQEIAEELVITVSTVKWHVNNLFGKLSVRSRTQALARARELGLL